MARLIAQCVSVVVVKAIKNRLLKDGGNHLFFVLPSVTPKNRAISVKEITLTVFQQMNENQRLFQPVNVALPYGMCGILYLCDWSKL